MIKVEFRLHIEVILGIAATSVGCTVECFIVLSQTH